MVSKQLGSAQKILGRPSDRLTSTLAWSARINLKRRTKKHALQNRIGGKMGIVQPEARFPSRVEGWLPFPHSLFPPKFLAYYPCQIIFYCVKVRDGIDFPNFRNYANRNQIFPLSRHFVHCHLRWSRRICFASNDYPMLILCSSRFTGRPYRRATSDLEHNPIYWNSIVSCHFPACSAEILASPLSKGFIILGKRICGTFLAFFWFASHISDISHLHYWLYSIHNSALGTIYSFRGNTASRNIRWFAESQSGILGAGYHFGIIDGDHRSFNASDPTSCSSQPDSEI